MKLSDKVYKINLGVPDEFEDMSHYSAYLGNGVVSLEKRIAELEAALESSTEDYLSLLDTNAAMDKRLSELKAENERLREDLTDLGDRFKNGIKYDEENNQYVLCWTEREIEQVREEAKRILTVFKNTGLEKSDG